MYKQLLSKNMFKKTVQSEGFLLMSGASKPEILVK
jgi:hypothetical protein